MLSTVLSYADKSEAVDSETDDGTQVTALLIMTKYCPPPKTMKGTNYFLKTLAYLTRLHSSKILTIQQGITRGVSSVGKPCRPEHGFPRPNCPGNAPIF